MSERYFVAEPLSPGPILLQGPEAHHLAVVCRLRQGDAVCLFNGDGHEYPGRIVSLAKKSVTVDIESRRTPQRELAVSLEIAAPLPKGDRAQFLVEKLTELGVARFVPLRCRRGVIEPREGKLEKLTRYVIEASKQCGRNVLMEVTPVTTWEDYCREGGADVRVIADPEGRPLGAALAGEEVRGSLKYRGAVGPEGGFTAEEIVQARDAGWQLVSLGARILRVETAALTLAASLGFSA